MTATPTPTTSTNTQSRLKLLFLHCLGAVFWIFLVVKLFVLDVDAILLRSFAPKSLWLLDFKFFIFGAIFLFFWLLAPRTVFRKIVLFTLFYPLVLLFWIVPKNVLKNWTVACFVIFVVLSSLVALKSRVALSFVAALSCVLILFAQNRLIIQIAMVGLFLYLLVHLLRHLRVAFRPIAVFERLRGLITKHWGGVRDAILQPDLTALATLPRESADYRSKRGDNLHKVLLLNRATLFVAHQLQRVRESRLMIGYCLASMFYTSIVTIVVYAFEYYALVRLDPASFDGYTGQGVWFFMYQSFMTLRSGSSPLDAASTAARILTVFESATAVYIGVVLVWLIATIFRERYSHGLTQLVHQLQEEGVALETTLVSQHHMSMQEAEAELRQINESAFKLIAFFTIQSPNNPDDT